MPFMYTAAGLAANASYAIASANVEDPTLAFRQAVRGFDITAMYANGRASAATTISGISYMLRRWTTAGSGGTSVTPAPKRLGTTASTTVFDKASAITQGTVSGAIQASFGTGKAGPGGWVARDADSTIHVEAGSADEISVNALSGETLNHYVWGEFFE